MKNVTSQLDNKLDLNFIVPYGLFETIYPWGVSLIQEYLEKTVPDISTKIYQLNVDQELGELQKEYSEVIGKLLTSLKQEAVLAVCGFNQNDKVFFSLVAYLGSDFIRIAQKHHLIKKSSLFSLTSSHFLSQLDQLKEKLERFLCSKLKLQSQDFGLDSTSTIWAFSVYDSTLFECLALARFILSKTPNATILLGGDYFNFENASVLVRQHTWIDAIIVGYGEEVTQRIVQDVLTGAKINELDYDGLVNQRSINDATHEPKVNIPVIYQDMTAVDYLSFVKKGFLRDNTFIKILTQRGCSWGKCSFCTEFCKFYYPISSDRLLAQLDAYLHQSTDLSGEIIVSIDSDEVTPEMLVKVLKYFNNNPFEQIHFEIYCWLQVKLFNEEVAYALHCFKPANAKIHLNLNFESLNRGILKNMIKGHLPLQALEAAKIIQDCGVSILTNYFLHFPLEKLSDIKDEVNILKNSIHLLVPPLGEIEIFPYCANPCDLIYRNQEKYQAVIEKYSKDVWNQEVFGVNLHFSNWSYSYKERFGWSPENLLRWSYRQAINTFGTAIGYVFFVLHYAVAFITGKTYYIRRLQILDYLSSLSNLKCSAETGQDFQMKIPRFYIKDEILHHEYDTPISKKCWSQKLDGLELQMIRFLYWERKISDILSHFHDQVSEKEIEAILSHHVKLGSIIHDRGRYLCVAHDPEYWNTVSAGNIESECKVGNK